MSTFIILLGFIALIVGIVQIVIALIKKKPKKQPAIILVIGIVLFIVGGFIATPDDQKKTDGDDNAKNEKVETDKEDETKEVDKKEKKEKPKKENNKEEKPYTDEQEDGLLESYNEIIDESDGVIQKIEQEDNYDIINVYVDDSFENMPKEQRQEFVDDFGNKIENNTRARLFGAGSDDFKYVYFMNSKQEHVAKTGHLDKSWKVK